MKSLRSFQEDDENDTHLFTAAEEYVLKNHPNPERIGCPGPATLREFVEAPGDLELSELNDIHIMQCAECTRDLIELRRQRSKERHSPPIRMAKSIFWNWKLAGIAACLCLFAFCLSLRYQRDRQEEVARLSNVASIPVAVLVDLSGDGVERGTEKSEPHPISLPNQLLKLHLMLPYYSPSGRYCIFLATKKDTTSLIASTEGTATANGPHTELNIEIDLRQVEPGNYFLGTQGLGQGAPYYYAVTIN